tara:strand:+ start:3848 stop:5542 length:1695 start_codon:yes stop_codon:yes gene_type:complete
MNLGYKKNDNSKLFTSLEQTELLNVENPQNYIPIYKRFFSLTSSNKETINLNNNLSLHDISEKETENKFNGTVIDNSNNIYKKKIFFKLSPLLDPIKYMTDKYDLSNSDLLNLPEYDISNSHKKVRDVNNSAYVDSFFTYLSSQILHNHNFFHGVDFYGSFLAHKLDYMVDIADDIEYLFESKNFNKNKNSLFVLDNKFHSDIFNYDTRNYKKKLIIEDNSQDNIQLSDINDISILDTLFVDSINKQDIQPDLLYEEKNISNIDTKSDTSSCSSRSSNTNSNNSEEEEEENNSDIDTDDESDTSLCSDASDDKIFVKFPKFPIQVIALERCSKTLDTLLINKDLSDKEWGSIVIQILMMLITYQKMFKLTHNDLHSSNIMYIETDKQFVYYKYNSKYFKVPTYGKILKIIDYGRAIYKFRGNLICSDSFHSEGDAATQYNFEPYLNEKKPRLEPNFSFDLCRLGCSLFDVIVDDLDNISKIKSPILKIILEWCKDDKGRNVMYKKNGDERYPDFKLYKMIARTVHNHIPQSVIEHIFFESYVVGKKKIKKPHQILNIDELPCYE